MWICVSNLYTRLVLSICYQMILLDSDVRTIQNLAKFSRCEKRIFIEQRYSLRRNVEIINRNYKLKINVNIYNCFFSTVHSYFSLIRSNVSRLIFHFIVRKRNAPFKRESIPFDYPFILLTFF